MPDHIKSYWDNSAQKHGQSHSASWGDIHCINLEIAHISEFIREGDLSWMSDVPMAFPRLFNAKKSTCLP